MSNKKIFLSHWQTNAAVSYPENLDVTEISGEIVMFDATRKLQNFFTKYGDAKSAEELANMDSILDTFLQKLNSAAKITFIDSVFLQKPIKSFAADFGFELEYPKGIFSTNEDSVRNSENEEYVNEKSTTAIPLFMQKCLKKKLRVAAVFVSPADCKGIIESMKKHTFPMNLAGIYLDPKAPDLVKKTTFIDYKVILTTIDCCWGKPLAEKFDYVFGFFGGCNRKPLSWEKTKSIRKFGNARKVYLVY